MFVTPRIRNVLVCLAALVGFITPTHATIEVYLVADPYGIYARKAIQKYSARPNQNNRSLVELRTPTFQESLTTRYNSLDMALLNQQLIRLNNPLGTLLKLPNNLADKVMGYLNSNDIDIYRMISALTFQKTKAMDRRNGLVRAPLTRSTAKSPLLGLSTDMLGLILNNFSMQDILSFGEINRFTYRLLTGGLAKPGDLQKYLMKQMLTDAKLGPSVTRHTQYSLNAMFDHLHITDTELPMIEGYINSGPMFDYLQKLFHLFNTKLSPIDEIWKDNFSSPTAIKWPPLRPVPLRFIDRQTQALEDSVYSAYMEVRSDNNKVETVHFSGVGLNVMFLTKPGTEVINATEDGGLYRLRNETNLKEKYKLRLSIGERVFSGRYTGTDMLRLMDLDIKYIIREIYGGATPTNMGRIMHRLWQYLPE